MQNLHNIREIDILPKTTEGAEDDSLVSFLAQVPEPLKLAMTTFIESHPNWDQYRLIQAALAGFLVQNGVKERSITRMYLNNMFSGKTFGEKA